jgi:hypothetical protein
VKDFHLWFWRGGILRRLHDDRASPHREEPPHGGVSNGETRLTALLRMRTICACHLRFTSS